jgi:hypothetical protein
MRRGVGLDPHRLVPQQRNPRTRLHQQRAVCRAADGVLSDRHCASDRKTLGDDGQRLAAPSSIKLLRSYTDHPNAGRSDDVE